MSKPTVKYCKYCGSELSADSIFCENCGENLIDNPSTNANPIGTEIKYCKTCGATFHKGAKICPNCGVNTFQPIAAQLKKCKYCHGDIATNAIQCPHCGKQNPYFILIVAILAIVLIFMFSFNSILSNNSNIPDSNSVDISASNQTSSMPAETHNSQSTVPTTTDKIIYEDNVFSVAYMKTLDAPEGISATYLQLKIKNKSSDTLTLSLSDVYVNDVNVYTGTGMPIKLAPGKISQTPFVLFTGNLGITANDIYKLEFKLNGTDDNFNTLHTTGVITIGK